jgi:AcrR family transcriptional regulator
MMPTSAPNENTRARLGRKEARARIIAAATELVRERSYEELSVGEIMRKAGLERTIFYRHFDDLGDLLLRAGSEAIEGLYATEVDLGAAREGGTAAAVRAAMEPAATVYHRHGPLLRALAEAAAAGNVPIAAGQDAMYRRFDELVAHSLGELTGATPDSPEIEEMARALNLLNVAYFLDAFGREPRISLETAIETVTEIWTAVIQANPTNGGG